MAKPKCQRCTVKCGKDSLDAEMIANMEAAFKKFAASASKSLLKKYLTQEIFDNLKTKQTSFGSTLLDCVQSGRLFAPSLYFSPRPRNLSVDILYISSIDLLTGFENLDSGVGIYAPDAQAYTVFADIFNPIIEDYHIGFKKTDSHPPTDWGDLKSLSNLDPNGQFIVSTRVRTGRSLVGFPFNPRLNEKQYKDMEKKVTYTLEHLTGELKGQYYPLTGMSKTVQNQLIEDHFLFKEGDRFLQAANACRFWPTGRGIFHNATKTFLVWVNEEDHLRIISLQPGGNLGEVYRRFVKAVQQIEKDLPFSRDPRLGYLTFCPTNLGTAIRASVHIKVPKLAANMNRLNALAAKYNLQVRGTSGEHTEAVGGVYDISNKRRLGLTEYQAIKEMQDGVTEIIKLERSSK